MKSIGSSSRLLLAALAILVGLWVAPARADSGETLRKKVAVLTNQLVHLPFHRAAPARVSQLVLKLSHLAPQYSNSYFRWGISKLPYTDYNNHQKRLAKQVISILKASTLPGRRVSKIITQIKNAVRLSEVPTPPPYQA